MIGIWFFGVKHHLMIRIWVAQELSSTGIHLAAGMVSNPSFLHFFIVLPGASAFRG